jgi:hypothetical protein
VEVNHAVAETPCGQQIEPQPNMVRLGLLAASHQDGRDNQVVFVHPPRLYGMGGEAGCPLASRLQFAASSSG